MSKSIGYLFSSYLSRVSERLFFRFYENREKKIETCYNDVGGKIGSIMRKNLLLILGLVLFSNVFASQGKRIEDYAKGLRPWEQTKLDAMFAKIAEEIFRDFSQIESGNLIDDQGRLIERVGIWPFEGDMQNKFYNRFRSMVVTVSRYRVYERKDLDKSLQELGLQESDIYASNGQKRLGQMTQWNGLIYGTVNISAENLLGKRKLYLSVNSHFNNIVDGRVIWTKEYSEYFKPQIPFNFFIYGLVIILGLSIALNIMSRGRRASLVAGFFIFLASAYTVWFFVI